jgi:hypothetical protein
MVEYMDSSTLDVIPFMGNHEADAKVLDIYLGSLCPKPHCSNGVELLMNYFKTYKVRPHLQYTQKCYNPYGYNRYRRIEVNELLGESYMKKLRGSYDEVQQCDFERIKECMN